MYINSLFIEYGRSCEMNLRILLFLSVMVVLVFPQYAFSIEPSSNSSNNAISNSTNSNTVIPNNVNSNTVVSNSTNSNTVIPNNVNSNTVVSNSTNSNTVIPNNVNSNTAISNNTNSSIVPKTTITIDSTSSTITSNSGTAKQGSPVSLTVRVMDTSTLPTITTGTVTWSDGNLGGTFNPPSCTLSSGTCTVSYTLPANYGGAITIGTSYNGDGTHSGSTGTSTLTATTIPSVTTTITSSTSSGSQVQFTATLADVSNPQITPTGTVTWSDGNIGGTFDQSSCILSSGTCTVSYTPPANYGSNILITTGYTNDGSFSTSTGTFTLMAHALPNTSTTVIPSVATVNRGSQVQFTAKVDDASNLPTIQTGTVTWSDGNIGGTFDQSSCTISSGTCTVLYTPPASTTNLVTITATYGTNNEYSGSTGTSILTINSLPSTATTVTPATGTINQGSQIQFTATVTGTSNQQITPTGTVTWSDGNLGGTFNPSSCILSSGTCTTTYTAPLNYNGAITITASYGGDTANSGSTGTSALTLDVLHNTVTTVTPNVATVAQGSKYTVCSNTCRYFNLINCNWNCIVE